MDGLTSRRGKKSGRLKLQRFSFSPCRYAVLEFFMSVFNVPGQNHMLFRSYPGLYLSFMR